MSGLLLNPVSCFAAQDFFANLCVASYHRHGRQDRELQECLAEITPLIAVPPIPQGRELQK